MDVFTIVKAKLPAEQQMDDTLFSLYIAEVGQAIKTYLNRSDIPPALSFVHANMVIDLINGERRKTEPAGQAAVSSIKEGDVTVQFGSVKADSRELATQALLFNYADQLNRFRRLRW